MNLHSSPLADILLAEVRRRLFEESIPRLEKCLGLLTEAEIWYRPNARSNAVGNLVLHLCGNSRQWIISTLGREPDRRERQAEFDEQGPLPAGQLLEMLRTLRQDLERVLDQISPAMLVQRYQVQGFEESGAGILIHVVEHFSYHVGQVTYFVKAYKGVDTGYYAGQNLDMRGAGQG